MKITAAGLTDVGLQREHNEDSYSVLEDFNLYVVADGMGGHRAGDVASQMATDAIATFFRATQSEDTTWPFHFDPSISVDENRLITSVKVANRKIFEASHRNRDLRNMGTTVVSIVFSRRRPRAYIAHVGDSRCYRIRKGMIQQLTRDHSLLNDYLQFMPDMPPERQEEIPKNVITRALGMQDTIIVDLSSELVEENDRYLLCSDGLTGMVDDADICRIISAAGDDLEKAAKDLIAAANERGGDDNITAVVLRAREVPAEVEDDTERQRRELGGAKTLEMELEGDDDIARANTVELDMNERPTQSPPSDEPEAGASATAESSDSESASEASPGRKPGARAKGGRRAKSERSPRKKKS